MWGKLSCFNSVPGNDDVGGAGGKGVWGKPGLELEETGACVDVHDPNYDSDSQVTNSWIELWSLNARCNWLGKKQQLLIDRKLLQL